MLRNEDHNTTLCTSILQTKWLYVKTLKLAHITDHLTPSGPDGSWSERWDTAAEVSETCRVLWCLDTQGAWEEGHLKQALWVRGGGRRAPTGNGHHMQKAIVGWTGTERILLQTVVTRQELITRGNYCLAHFLWHRTKTPANMPGMLPGHNRPTYCFKAFMTFRQERLGWAGIRKPPVLILQSTWSCSQHGMPGWGDDLCELL